MRKRRGTPDSAQDFKSSCGGRGVSKTYFSNHLVMSDETAGESFDINNSKGEYLDCTLGSIENDHESYNTSFDSRKSAPDYHINSPALLRGLHFKEDVKLSGNGMPS